MFPEQLAGSPIVALALFGSRARGDHDPDADVDLLAVTSGGAPATVVRDRITLSRYPVDEILRRARGGDLFVLHIASESTVLFEAWPVFDDIRRTFRYRDDYTREIGIASDLGWFLVRFAGRFSDPKWFNEQVAWCTRTIVIARAASEQRPIFSATGLAEFSAMPAVVTLIRNRKCGDIDVELVARFGEVLAQLGAPAPPVATDLDAQRQMFESRRNAPGRRAVRMLTASRPAGSRSCRGRETHVQG